MQPSELVLNPDGSVYHLNLRPEDVAPIVITVGDLDRVAQVSRHFDSVRLRKQKREFITHTGRLGNKDISVVSTGIGPDNIDIVLNELDALYNIDLVRREPLPQPRSVDIIRLGTTGALQADLGLDQLLFSTHGLGLDNLLHYYEWEPDQDEKKILTELHYFLENEGHHFPAPPYLARADAGLLSTLAGDDARGITFTAPGFYAPQGRRLRAASRLSSAWLDTAAQFRSEAYRPTNFEMETAAIYGLARVLGHRALSCSVVLANRPLGQFSENATAAIDRMIETMLERIAAL